MTRLDAHSRQTPELGAIKYSSNRFVFQAEGDNCAADPELLETSNYLIPALLLILALALGACTVVPPQPAASPVLATATSAPDAGDADDPLPTATDGCRDADTPTAPAPSTDSLVQLVQSGLPAGAFEGVVALPLAVPAGQPPLWAVYSVGMRNFDLTPLPNHFVAIYTQANGDWQELARQEFSSGDPTVAAP